MKNLYYIPVLLLILFACKQETENKNDSQLYSPLPLLDKNYELVTSGELSFALDSLSNNEPFYMDVIHWNSEKYLGVVNRYINAIELYDFKTQQLWKRTVFQTEGPDGIGTLEAFYWVNKDSIFVLSSFKNQMAWVNMEGKLVSKPNYDGERAKGTTLVGSNEGRIHRFGDSFFLEKGIKNWFIGTMKNYYANNPQKLILKYDYLKDQHFSMEVDFPEVYKQSKGILLPKGANFYKTLGKNGTILTSFPFDHKVWLTHVDSSYFFQSIEAKSKYANQPLIKPYEGEVLDLERLRAESLTASYYRAIIYDKYRDIFYRFNEIAVKDPYHSNTKRLLDGDYSKPFSILILDSNYQVIGETLFSSSGYLIDKFFIDEDGLHISINNPFNKEAKEDLLEFKLFKLQAVKP